MVIASYNKTMLTVSRWDVKQGLQCQQHFTVKNEHRHCKKLEHNVNISTFKTLCLISTVQKSLTQQALKEMDGALLWIRLQHFLSKLSPSST